MFKGAIVKVAMVKVTLVEVNMVEVAMVKVAMVKVAMIKAEMVEVTMVKVPFSFLYITYRLSLGVYKRESLLYWRESLLNRIGIVHPTSCDRISGNEIAILYYK